MTKVRPNRVGASDPPSAREAEPSSIPRPVPVRGRLETRVVAALALLGFLCVGASAYLVSVFIQYFDSRLEGALSQSDELVTAIRPFHEDLIEAHIAAYRARARALALEVRSLRGEADVRGHLADRMQREADLARVRVRLEDGRAVETERSLRPGEAIGQVYEVDVPPEVHEGVLVAYRIDEEVEARYRALGQRKRVIERLRQDQPRLERAVVVAAALGSGAVLVLSLLGGVVLARATTRKVTELSEVMQRVAGGRPEARVEVRGEDELSRLGLAFNDMLDRLDAAKEKVGYLQRIAAWQDVARRIAHEIKNPLTPIQLVVQQLRDKDPKNDPAFSALLSTSVSVVEDEVEGLRRLVSTFSRLSKLPDAHLEPTSMARLLREFEHAYGHLTERPEDRLEVVAVQEDVVVLGDRQLLKQVLVNLVENAVSSTREAGSAPVHVRVRVEVHPKRHPALVEIWVEDNGPGVAEARRAEIFEPYVTTRVAGTGLGLAIVKKIILDHGGDVGIAESELGGAAFVLRLRRAVGGTVSADAASAGD